MQFAFATFTLSLIVERSSFLWGGGGEGRELVLAICFACRIKCNGRQSNTFCARCYIGIAQKCFQVILLQCDFFQFLSISPFKVFVLFTLELEFIRKGKMASSVIVANSSFFSNIFSHHHLSLSLSSSLHHVSSLQQNFCRSYLLNYSHTQHFRINNKFPGCSLHY